MFLFLSSVAAGYAQPTLRAVGYLAPMATKKKGMLTAASERGKHLRHSGRNRQPRKSGQLQRLAPTRSRRANRATSHRLAAAGDGDHPARGYA